MKKKILIMGLLLIFCLSFVACGSTGASNETAQLMATLEGISTASDYVTSVTYTVWDEAGPEKVASVLYYMAGVKVGDDLDSLIGHGTYIEEGLEAYGYEGYSHTHGYPSEEKEEFATICSTYGSSLATISANISKAEELIVTIKEKDEDTYEAIKDYYIATIEYGEFALNPSGSLISYARSVSEYKSTVSALKKSAELDVK